MSDAIIAEIIIEEVSMDKRKEFLKYDDPS